MKQDANGKEITPHRDFILAMRCYQDAQSLRRSLRLKIRQNSHRPDIKTKAQLALDGLIVPGRPYQVHGWQLFLNGEYHGFTTDRDEYLDEVSKYGAAITAKIKPAASW